MAPLRQRYLEDLQLRNYSVKTQQLYIECVSLFARHFNRSPEQLGPDEIRAYRSTGSFLQNSAIAITASLRLRSCATVSLCTAP